MPRCTLIAELATNHGGDLALALDMVAAAADAGADIVKTQGYQIANLPRSDPQYDWFAKSELSCAAHEALMDACAARGIRYLSTAYTVSDLKRLQALGLRMVKIGSGEGRDDAFVEAACQFFTVYVSLPWGARARDAARGLLLRGGSVVPTDRHLTWLGTVPLYPAPIETYALVAQQDGYSDHHVGIDIARLAIARGATVLEKHFHLVGLGRNQPWNMTVTDLAILRAWAETCQTAMSGTRFQERWRP